MSYILDALKRAETERDRGAVPTLSTQPIAPERFLPPSNAKRQNTTLIACVVLALVLLAVLAWRWMAASPPDAPVADAPAQAAPAQVLPPPAQVLPPVHRALAVVPATAPVRVPAPVQVVTASQPSPVSAGPMAYTDLPEATRRSLPPLKPSGAMYSSAPGDRILFLNSQVLHEGDTVAPGLVLERIGEHNAQLSYRGQHFTVDF